MAKKIVRSKVTIGGELAFPSEYLGNVDLQGRDIVVTIASVTKEQVKMTDGGVKSKLVMRFVGKNRKLILNKTNADSIATMHGTAAEQWAGKRITLYPTRCMAFGEMTDCLRIREKVPPAPGAKPGAAPTAPEPAHEPAEDIQAFADEMSEALDQQ